MIKSQIGSKKKLIQYTLIIFLLVAVNLVVSSKVVNSDIPIYSTVSVFLLINMNIVLLLALIILIFRNLGKLFFDRRKSLFGTRLQSKLVIFSIILTVFPVFVVFTFSSAIITNSIDKWFDVQIEQALKSSIALMQKYQNQLEEDLIEQTNILAQLITSKRFLLKRNYDDLKEFSYDYLSRNRIDGIAVFNNQKRQIVGEDKNYLLNEFITDEVLDDILKAKQVARYDFIENEQIYWIGQPIYSKVNDKIVIGALFIYKAVPANQAAEVTKILDSYNNYSQIKFFSQPVENSYKILLVLMTLLVVFAGIWGSLVFAKSITEPLEKLAEASIKVSQGDLDVSLEKTADDEVGILMDSFNEMTEKLKKHNQEMNLKNKELSEMYNQIAKDSQYIDTIFKNVKSAILMFDSDLKILNLNNFAHSLISNENQDFIEMLYSELDKFKKSDMSEKSFQIEVNFLNEVKIFVFSLTKINTSDKKMESIVMVIDDITDVMNFERINIWREIATRIAHEIKNPLTPIKLTAERVKKKSQIINDEGMKMLLEKSMDTVINEVNELYLLVNEFNSFARHSELKKEYFELNDFFDDILNIYQQSHPNVLFSYNTNTNISIRADKSQFKRVFYNLINNSLQAFNKDNPEISISVEYQNHMVQITYRDNGSGIAPNDISKIFIPYFSKKTEGTGLGLAIVKKIIEEHNGKIVVKSELGKYTEFIITIPEGT
jgi:two-component system nitrogen regulation sensor histidine kinase NtrY